MVVFACVFLMIFAFGMLVLRCAAQHNKEPEVQGEDHASSLTDGINNPQKDGSSGSPGVQNPVSTREED